MAFDLSTARPYKPTGFDLTTARPYGAPASPPETRPRAEVEAELAQREAASNDATAKADRLGPFREPVRIAGRAATALARGALGLPRLLETAVTAPLSAVVGSEVKGPVQRAQEFMSPTELAPQNPNERTVDLIEEFTGGAATGIGAGNAAAKAASPVTRAVGESLSAMPGRQLAGAVTGASAAADVEQNRYDYRNVPWPDITMPLLAGAAPFIGAPGTAGEVAPVRPPRPFGADVEHARQLGVTLEPGSVAAKAQLSSPQGEMPTVPGRFREAAAGAEFPVRNTIENNKLFNTYTNRELGLTEGTQMDPAALDAAKGPANAAYDHLALVIPELVHDEELTRAFSALGETRRDNPYLQNRHDVEQLRDQLLSVDRASSQQALDAIRQYRRDARILFKRADDPAAQDAADSYRQAADALEEALDRAAARSGDPTLVQTVRDARTRLAKINNVEDALNGTNVDAHALARLAERGVPLSGYLKEMARVATNFPSETRSATGLSIPEPFTNSAFANLRYAGRRLLGDRLIPNMLSENFQGKYGEFDPNYRPGFGGNGTPWPPAPPTPPTAPPPAPPPPDGRFPHARAGEGPLGLADQLTGGVPFSETQIPPAGGDGFNLAEALSPDFGASNAPDVPGMTLPGPLDAMLGSGVGPGETPFTPTQTAAPGLQPGRSIGLADQLAPEPGPFGPDVSPTPPGPNDPTPFTRGPRAGGPDTRPGALGLAPENAHELPNGLGDLLASPEAKSLVDRLLGGFTDGNSPAGNPLDALSAALGLDNTPPGPMNPPKGPRGLRGLGDELTKSGLEPPAAPGEFPDLALEDSPARGTAPPDFDAIKDAPPDGSVTLGDGKARSIVVRPIDGRIRIQHTEVAPEMQGQGLNRQNITSALNYAKTKNMPLDSDVSFTRAAWKSWKSALDAGVFKGDYDRAAIEAAFERDPGVARNPSGEPWIRNIDFGPAS
jgi:hypothetical protein